MYNWHEGVLNIPSLRVSESLVFCIGSDVFQRSQDSFWNWWRLWKMFSLCLEAILISCVCNTVGFAFIILVWVCTTDNLWKDQLQVMNIDQCKSLFCFLTAASASVPAFFKNPLSSATIPLPPSKPKLYEPSGLTSDWLLTIGTGSLPFSLSAATTANNARVRICKNKILLV